MYSFMLQQLKDILCFSLWRIPQTSFQPLSHPFNMGFFSIKLTEIHQRGALESDDELLDQKKKYL